MLNISKVPEYDKIVFCGISDIGVLCAEQVIDILGNREYYFTDIGVEEVNEEFIFVKEIKIPIISLEKFYEMGSDISVFCYSDNERINEKVERLQMHGIVKLHFMVNELVLKYYGALDKLENTKAHSTRFVNLMRELVVMWNTKYNFPRYYRPHSRETILVELDKLAEVYDMLADELSRKTYENILKYRFCGESSYLTEVLQENQYFQDEIFSFTDEEVMIDGGAAQGDSILEFVKFCNDKYRRIYSFEANNNYCKGMKYCFKNENVQIINKGLYDKNTVLFWHESGHGSRFMEDIPSNCQLEVVSLDNTIQEKVTFIKMDIEGAEQNALIGAQNIIQRDKPKLAICVYHKENDLWDIPILIKKLNPEYKIYLRQHYDVMDEETVCYACI